VGKQGLILLAKYLSSIYTLNTFWSSVHVEVTVTQLAGIMSNLRIEPQGSVPLSQEKTTGPYPRPDVSSRHPHTLHVYCSYPLKYYHPVQIWNS
jgi:hypothetical protein